MTQQDDSIQIVPDPDKLDRYHRQQLSAMLDGELSPDQARFMLRRLQHDAELAGCWERWQVCGDVLRGQRNALLPADFAQKVSAAIAAGGRDAARPRARAGGPRLLRWGGGAALAASVAMVALLVGRQAGIGQDQAPVHSFPGSVASGESVPETPPKEDPAPVLPLATGATAALAGAGTGAAEAPRRSAAGRDRQERGSAAARDPAVTAGIEEGPRVAAAARQGPSSRPAAGPAAEPAAPQSAPEDVTALFAQVQSAGAREGIGADPFQALPMTVASRPWPRAAAAGAVDDYAVGFGSAVLAAPGWPTTALPRRPAVAELFGLPAEAVELAPGLPAATAIGTRTVGTGEAPAAQPSPYPGPR